MIQDDGSHNNLVSMRILVVDDNEDAAELLGLLLARHGHVVSCASDGLSALTLSAEFRPNVAVLDLEMPGMDGYELARRLREQHVAVQTIAVSGYRLEDRAVDCAEPAFDEHLVKPIDVSALLRLVAAGRRSNGAQGAD
jgi:CheY-like chemotaxis protein